MKRSKVPALHRILGRGMNSAPSHRYLQITSSVPRALHKAKRNQMVSLHLKIRHLNELVNPSFSSSEFCDSWDVEVKPSNNLQPEILQRCLSAVFLMMEWLGKLHPLGDAPSHI